MSTNPGRIDKYELQELLGQGGTTEVWKAFDTQARRYVAIKLLHANLQVDPTFMTRFQHEVQVIASLRHPNIVPYYDFSLSQPPGMGATTASLVMDYVDGGNLADYTRNTSRKGHFLPAVDIVRLFITIGTAIDYAHRRGIVHGQLKPTNILLDKHHTSGHATGEPVVSDFGMIKLLGAAGSNTSGWRLDTALYTSPEQIIGSAGDERSDIYSLGIMLYEICTGTPPFPGSNAAVIMMQQMNTIPASPALMNPSLPAALTTIIMRSIAKEPSARFPNASSLIEALTHVIGQEGREAANISVPVNAGQPAYPVKAVDLPTVLSSGEHSPPAGMAPAASTPSLPGISGASLPPFPLAAMTPEGGEQGGQVAAYYYTTPASGVAGSSQPYPTVQPGGPDTPLPVAFPPAHNLPAGSPPVPTPAAPPSQKPRRRALWIISSALLVLVVIGSVLGAYFTFFSKSTPPAATAPGIVGYAYFVSSGLLSANPASNQGITDQLQVSLTHIPPPPQGKSYYAWLLNDRTLEWNPIRLGQLSVNNGTAVLSYAGDAFHSNLLATNSRFFVTEEDAAEPPVNPSQDVSALVYYAEFSQTPNPADPEHYSLYDHIRHLLSNDPKVKQAGLSGGLDIWLYRNTQKILEWAGSARDAQRVGDVAFMRRQFTRILDYLDGTYYIQQDLPGKGLLVDPTIAKIGLLTFDAANQQPPGYIYHVGKHLREITILPQSTPEQRALAGQINQALNVVDVWFHTIRADALRLYSMSDAQLLGNQARSVLNDAATLANEAFAGQINSQGQVLDGVVQIHYDIQRLATFDIRACTASSPCPALV